VLTDHLSEVLFAPTEAAVGNLGREGIASHKVHLIGDVMYDAAIYYGTRARSRFVEACGLAPKSYVLVTVHRAENTDVSQRLRSLVDGLIAVAAHVPVVLPLHPRTRAALERERLLDRCREHLRLLEPVGYLEMVALERQALLIATDSGGVQKEAFFSQVPCVTLRDETEWVELVERGWNRLLPPDRAETVTRGLLAALNAPVTLPMATDLYGGGNAVPRLVALLRRPAA
jgi:UDP-GlcNAc3NAcA epimerase